ncbi:hypothetical protein D3C85_569330 [compost metagenome]
MECAFLILVKKSYHEVYINRTIIIKYLIAAIGILVIKNFIFKKLSLYRQDFPYLIELSDITIVFTEAFFVFGLLLAATMTAFKESEKRGVDKEAIKGIQKNTNEMRKQLTLGYSISRNNFIKPAYTLLQSILFLVMSLLLITKFKSPSVDYLVTSAITFLFCYLYLLIRGLDDPFDLSNGETDVDLKPIDRFKQRLLSDFLVSNWFRI